MQKQMYDVSAFVSTIDNNMNEITSIIHEEMKYIDRRLFGI